MGFGAAMVRADWLAFNSLWLAPTPPLLLYQQLGPLSGLLERKVCFEIKFIFLSEARPLPTV
jgi:hypothetical protein